MPWSPHPSSRWCPSGQTLPPHTGWVTGPGLTMAASDVGGREGKKEAAGGDVGVETEAAAGTGWRGGRPPPLARKKVGVHTGVGGRAEAGETLPWGSCRQKRKTSRTDPSRLPFGILLLALPSFPPLSEDWRRPAACGGGRGGAATTVSLRAGSWAERSKPSPRPAVAPSAAVRRGERGLGSREHFGEGRPPSPPRALPGPPCACPPLPLRAGLQPKLRPLQTRLSWERSEGAWTPLAPPTVCASAKGHHLGGKEARRVAQKEGAPWVGSRLAAQAPLPEATSSIQYLKIPLVSDHGAAFSIQKHQPWRTPIGS